MILVSILTRIISGWTAANDHDDSGTVYRVWTVQPAGKGIK